jgi:hypothetical protein
MANTMTLISNNTVSGTSTTNVTFSSIPSTYTDLKIIVSARNNDTGFGALNMTFNGDTGSNYSSKRLYGNGTSAASSSTATTSVNLYWIDSNDLTANTFSNGEIYISNYLSSSAKSGYYDFVAEANQTLAYASINAFLWTGTSAISSISITSGFYLTANTTFYLYGIKNS